jgi:DNA repair exonuclease SbcCD ATPase subunit
MELDSQIISRQGEKENLEEVIKELKETTSVLSQLKNDIENGSGQSAKRFTGIIQYYSSTINEMNSKKSALEKEIRRNIKTIIEKEQLIEEKQSSLEEMENMLNAGKSNFSLFEELMQFLGEQKKLLLINKNFIDEYSQDSVPITRNEITENKLTEFENALNDLLHSDTDYSTDLINRRIALEQEVEENNSVLNNLKEKISDSANDLSELRESVNKIKVEHEEHRVAINKLASMKQKLIEEINKQQIIVDKYSKIKEMIRQEQELIKLKRDFVTTQNLTNQSKTKEKIIDTHNPNWIKL